MRKLQFVKLAAIAVTLLTHFNAQAISLRLKEKIFSSGEAIYACNAGIATEQITAPVCYFHNIHQPGNECTPTSCQTAKSICNTDCICNDVVGSKWVNSLMASQQPFTDQGQVAPAPVALPDLIAYSPAFNQFNPDQSTVFDNWMTEFGTKFASENYTAAFFVDVCYRGTQLTNFHGEVEINTQVTAVPFLYPNITAAGGKYPLDNDRTGLLMGQGNYLSNADLTVQTFVVCSDTAADTAFTLDSNNVPTGAVSGYFAKDDPVPVNSSLSTKNLGDPVGQHFCKVRYVFRETNWMSTLVINSRQNAIEGAELCELTDITDPLAKQQNSTPAQ